MACREGGCRGGRGRKKIGMDQTTPLVVASLVLLCCGTESMRVGFQCLTPFVEAVVGSQLGVSPQVPWSI